MTAVTPNADGNGLTKGKAYTILGFTSSTALFLDDNNKLLHVSIADLNDDKLWVIGEEKKQEPKNDTKPSSYSLGDPSPSPRIRAEGTI